MKTKLTATVFSCLTFLLFSCGEKKEKTTNNNQNPPKDTSTQQPRENPDTQNKIVGYYVGDFEATRYNNNQKPSYSNKINICIDSINGTTIYGHSICAGNLVGFIGTVENKNEVYTIKDAKEQGANKYNGVFNFTLDAGKEKLTGTWKANNKKQAVSESRYDLVKKEFKYDPKIELPDHLPDSEVYNISENLDEYANEFEALTSDVIKFNASTTQLKAKDVENMFKGDLEVLRNSIYARHGYSFQNRKMRYIFDDIDWYIPVSLDVRTELTTIEKKNIDLIKRYEEHANQYYDSFSR